VTAAITVGTHTPLVPRFAHNSEARYNADLGARWPRGWEKYNRGYWQTGFPDFAEFFSEQLFVEPHSTKHRENGVRPMLGNMRSTRRPTAAFPARC
jgi:hypothetical protein